MEDEWLGEEHDAKAGGQVEAWRPAPRGEPRSGG